MAEQQLEISYGVENLRRIKQMQPMPLVPLTVVLGRNSAGKSTFIDSLALLRQSLARPRVQWRGEAADFGGFEEAVAGRAADKKISFIFEFRNLRFAGDRPNPYRTVEYRLAEGRNSRWVQATGETESGVRVRAEAEYGLDGSGGRLELLTGFTLPEAGGDFGSFHNVDRTGELIPQFPPPSGGAPASVDPDSSAADLRQYAEYWGPVLLNEGGQAVRELLAKSMHIGPVRPPPQRSYAPEPQAAAAQLAPDCANLPHLLRSLDADGLARFSRFIQDLLPCGIAVTETEGRFAIETVCKKSGLHLNAADGSDGFWRLLPVLLQAWLAAEASPAALPAVIGLAEPAGLLHPQWQAATAQALTAAAAAGTTVLVETHSETMVGHIGDLVENAHLPAAAARFLLFKDWDGDRYDEGGERPRPDSKAVQAWYDHDGRMCENWEYGFFNSR